MQKVAVVISIADSSDRTPGCLEECQRQIDAIQAEERYVFSIFMNTTRESGRRGIWLQTSKEGYDFHLWIDNDLRPAGNMLSVFLENSEFLRHKAIIAGTVSGPDKTLLSGGRSRRGKILEPDPIIPVPCHLFDADLVLVPAAAYSKLENPDQLFHRTFIDYGCGAKVVQAGVPRVIAPGILAETSRKPETPPWKNPGSLLPVRIGSLLKASFREFVRILHASFS